MTEEMETLLSKEAAKLHEHKGWYAKKQYNYLTVSGMITGCGIAQLYGVTLLDESAIRIELEKVKKDFNQAGMIVCTLGHYFKHHEQKILNCGFELLAEYPNIHHGNGEIQKLYGLKIKKNESNK